MERAPGGGETCPSFVSFNAEVDGAIVEKDAMVLGLARVGPGVRIPSGLRVLPGRSIDSQAEVATETVPVTEADREFMRGVVEVNTEFARGYTDLEGEHESNVHGINYDPGHSEFNPVRNLPTFAGVPTRDRRFSNRLIGDVRLADTVSRFSRVADGRISLRADEGEPFNVGRIRSLDSHAIFHALEHTSLDLGDGGRYGFHSIVHGGPTDFEDETITGETSRSVRGPSSSARVSATAASSGVRASFSSPTCPQGRSSRLGRS